MIISAEQGWLSLRDASRVEAPVASVPARAPLSCPALSNLLAFIDTLMNVKGDD